MFYYRKTLYSFYLEKYRTVEELEYGKMGAGENIVVSRQEISISAWT